MAAKRILSLLLSAGILAGCTAVPRENDPPFLSPASGGNVQLASVPAQQSTRPIAAWRFDDLERFTKWTKVLARLDRENALPLHWQKSAPQLAAMSVSGRAQAVNRYINSFAYIEDIENWGRQDYWGSPHEFFGRGGGDCEDFAIAKYAMLRDLGVPEDDLRITVVYDRYTKNMHAMLIVHSGEGTLLLDNQVKALRSDEAARRYHPVFGLGRNAWWLYSDGLAA